MNNMKQKLFILSILSMLLLLWQGCSEEKGKEPSPESPSTMVNLEGEPPIFEAIGGIASLTLTTTSDWVAVVDEAASDWLTLTPMSGKAGTYTLNLAAAPNENYDERNSSLTIASGDIKRMITVTQKQKDALILTSNKVEIEAEGGDFSIELQANTTVNYEIEANAQTWLTPVSRSRALTSSTLYFHADMNENEEIRQAVITLQGGKGLTEKVTVYQAGNTSNPILVLTQSEYIVGSAGETIKVELRSNTDYDIEMPNVNWLKKDVSRSISTYTHYFTVAPNESYDARTAEIRFVDCKNELEQIVSITQMQLDAIILAQSIYEMPTEGGPLDFIVQTNVDFEVSLSADWITQTEKRGRGLSERKLYFDIAPNDAETSREATITLQNKEIEQVVTVKQASKKEEIKPFLQLSRNEYTAESEGDIFDVTVQCNVDYYVRISESDWVIEEGSNNNVHHFRIFPNESNSMRTAEIFFISEENNLEEKLIVTQTGQEAAIIVSPNLYEMPAEGGKLEFMVQSNIDFEIDVDSNWLRFAEGNTNSGEHNLIFEVDSNDSMMDREAIITLSGTDGILQTVRVVQTGITPYVKILSPTGSSLNYNAETFEIKVEFCPNYDFYQIEKTDWINIIDATITEQNGLSSIYTITVSVDINESIEKRTGYIRFYNVESGISEQVNVVQTGMDAPYLTLVSVPDKLAAEGQEFVIKMESNRKDLTVNIGEAEWVILQDESVEQNPDGTIVFTYMFMASANTAYTARSSQIVISNETYGLSETIIVEQKGKEKPEGTIGTGNEPYDEEQGSWDEETVY